LISHPGQGNDTLAAMKGKPILIGAGSRATFWNFLKAKYGYTDDQIRPYTFNMAPFLADKSAIQQGYLTSEPYKIEQAGRSRSSTCWRTPVTAATRARSRPPGSSSREARPRPALRQRLDRRLVQLPSTAIPARQRAHQEGQPGHDDDVIAYGIARSRSTAWSIRVKPRPLAFGAMTDARLEGVLATMAGIGSTRATSISRRPTRWPS